jgi:hypothetical protein
MTDSVQTRVATFQQLERLIRQAQQIQLDALQRADLADEDYAAVVSHYQRWFDACLALLPPDLQHAFRDAYADLPLHPRLETYLKAAREPNPTPRPEPPTPAWSPWRYPFNYSFAYLFSNQQKVLSTFRERLMDIISRVPRDLKELIAAIFSGKEHSVFTVDGLFAQAGARREWWVKPVSSSGKKRDRVRGWFAGILLHAPDREREIVAAVCRAVIQHGLASPVVARRIETLLAQPVPADPGALLLPAARPYIAPRRLKALRTLAPAGFDLARLIRLCEELNAAMEQQLFLAAAMLTRALIEHVPPIFGAASFAELAANHGSRSFKAAMKKLDDAVLTIAAAHLPAHIRSTEALPSAQEVDVGPLLDSLLAEIVRVLKPAPGSAADGRSAAADVQQP